MTLNIKNLSIKGKVLLHNKPGSLAETVLILYFDTIHSFSWNTQIFGIARWTILLAEGGAVEQVAQLGRGQFRHLANLPLLVPGVVAVGGGGGNVGHLVVGLHADHGQADLLHEAAAGHGTGHW